MLEPDYFQSPIAFVLGCLSVMNLGASESLVHYILGGASGRR